MGQTEEHFKETCVIKAVCSEGKKDVLKELLESTVYCDVFTFVKLN